MVTTNYTDVFSGNLVGPAFPQYSATILSSNITLAWPTDFQNLNQVVTLIMDVSPTVDDTYEIKLPDATKQGTGFVFKINNPSGNDFDLVDNTNEYLVTISGGEAQEIWMVGNTTAAGSWRFLPVSGGSAVTYIDATSSSDNLTIAGVPIIGAGTIAFTLTKDLLALSTFNTGTGFAARTAANTWAVRSIIGTAGSIDVTDGDGISGNPTISLDDDIVVTTLQAGNLLLSGNTLSSTNLNGPIFLNPNGTGPVVLDNTNPLKFLANNGTNYISFQGGASAVNQTYIWPTTTPLTGQVMGFGGGSILEWLNIPTAPGSSTVNAIARFADTTGGLKDTPGVLLDDAGDLVALNKLTVSDIQIGALSSQTISTINADQSLILSPNGAGAIQCEGDIWVYPSDLQNTKLRFYNYGTAHYSGLIANSALNSTTTWSLPLVGGIAGVFTTNSSNAMSVSTTITGLTSITVGDITINGAEVASTSSLSLIATSGDVDISASLGSAVNVSSDLLMNAGGFLTPTLKLFNTLGFYSGIRANSATAANTTWNLPTADAAGVFLSDGSANMSILGTAAANQLLVSGASSSPSWTSFYKDYGNSGPAPGNLFLGTSCGSPSITAGNLNTGVGVNCLSSISTTAASSNTGVGAACLTQLTSGVSNTCVGYNSGQAIITGVGNCFFGVGSGSAATNNSNSGFGVNSLTSMTGSSTNNSALGYFAGQLRATYTQCTFLGATSDASVNALTNATAIGYGASVGTDNTVVIGNASVVSVLTSGAFKTTNTTASTTTATGSGIFGGGLGIAGNAFVGGVLNVTDSTASTSTTTGSGIFAGGLGVAKNSFFGGSLNITLTTDSTSSTTGAMINSGGMGIAKRLNVGTSLAIGVNRATALSPLEVVGTGGIFITDGAAVASAKQLNFSYDTAVDRGVIVAIHQGVDQTDILFQLKNLLINGTTGPTSARGAISMSVDTTATAVASNSLCLQAKASGTGTDVVPSWFGTGAGGISASVSNVVTTKVSIFVNGTRYYLLASTSGA
jgi:hypothetical protein